MYKVVSLQMAEYRAGVTSSLFEVILEKVFEECSPQLCDLICIACDANHEVHQALRSELGLGVAE